MKTKRTVIRLAIVVGLLCACVPAATAGIRVLVVPARYSVLQVAFDVASRHGVTLVSYQGEVTSDSPQLHYWSGVEWIRMSVDDYAQAHFLRSLPSTIILVGGEDMLPSVLFSRVSGWCPDVRIIPTVDTPTLLNSLGQEFSFPAHEWEWFARRYNLQLQDKNEEQRQQSWYDRESYEDEWSDRWHWLRRKHNVPQKERQPEAWRDEPAPVQDVYVEESVAEPAAIQSWPAAAEENVWEPISVDTSPEEEVYPVK